MHLCKLRNAFHYLNRFKLRLLTVLLLCLSSIAVLSYLFTAHNTLIIHSGGDATIVDYNGNAAQALLDAGIQRTELDSYTLNTDGVPQLVITKAKTVTICFEDGSSSTILCSGVTVADALEQLGLSLTEDDLLDHALTDPLTDPMQLQLSRAQISYRTDLFETDFETVYWDNSQLPAGTLSVFQAGEPGLTARTFRRVERDGEYVREQLVSSSICKAPVPAYIWRGTGDPGFLPVPSALTGSGSSRSSFASGPSPLPAGGAAIVSDDGTQIVTASGDLLRYSRCVSVSATAYTTQLDTDPNPTYTGTVARVGAIAVDPAVIPLGSRLFIVAADGSWLYGYAAAEDRGGGIQGSRIDLFFDSYQECINFGCRSAKVYILG